MLLDKILLDHGSGGLLTHSFIKKILVPNFKNNLFNYTDDGAILKLENNKIAFSTDSYVVDPIFFPGGSIGDLAINGTVNDISMCGAVPKFLSIALIIEEGLSITKLKKIINDISLASKNANIKIVTGDTKVVPKGAVDKIFINTTGIGIVKENINVSGKFAKEDDIIILSGTLADHGITIMTQQKGFEFNSNIKSDTAPLNGVINEILNKYKNIHVLRDPTRGGVGTSLNEIALESNVGIKIFEKNFTIKSEVLASCDILGFDPLYLANEGKFLIFVPSKDAKGVLSIIRENIVGKNACVIGKVVKNHPGKVFMKTSLGGERIVNMLTGEQLPRIC